MENKEGEIAMKRIIKKILYELKKIIFNFFSLLPLRNDYIIFESEGDFSDNSYAFFEYLINHKKEKYRFFWFVDDLNNECPCSYKIKKIKKRYKYLNFYYIYLLAVSKFYIYDHCDLYREGGFKKRNHQILLYLSHGFGFKSSKGNDYSINPPSFDKMIVTGEIPAKGNANWFQVDLNKTEILGYPRLDYFFNESESRKKKILKMLNIDSEKCNFLWMPTFRQSINKSLSEDYIENETGLPLFATKAKLDRFNEYMKEKNSMCYLKLHHLQAELPIFQTFYSHIRIIRDDELREKKIQLYEMIPLFNCLISDYSSITVDYLLLDKPIIYILDDYKKYKESRGIYPENALDYMVGYHIFEEKELYNALEDIIEEKDIYRTERNDILPLFHKYQDGNSSQRISEYLKL